MLIGYARVSTDDQDTLSQRRALKQAGCTTVYEDIASGADRDRPELARCLRQLSAGDTLVIARLDRIGRSLSHLLSIVEELGGRKIGFRSLADGFDTGSAQGRLMMHMLGAFAEFERELVRERTKAGLAIARAKGRVAGNPRFRARDQTAIALMRATQADTFTRRSRLAARPWLHIVCNLRPHESWEVVARAINAVDRATPDLPLATIKAHVRRLVSSGELPAEVLGRAMPRAQRSAGAVAALARQIKAENPDASLSKVGEMLEAQGVFPPRAQRWSKQAVRLLLLRESGG